MLFVRPAGPSDIEALLELAYLSGRGFTSLPEHRPTLVERLDLSAASFAQTIAPDEAWYTLMLEDSASGRIEGIASIRASVGKARPHFSFRVVSLTQYSSATHTRFEHKALVLVNECDGFTEVGSLFLRPGKRQSGSGALLARSRYMLIAAHRALFAETVMAEMRGWFDERDMSPFWEGIPAKFFRLPFEEADRMITSTDGQFILDLAPRHPIYLELVPTAAREAIGQVHAHGRPAMAMLTSEGFEPSSLIDLFDGGPTVTCRRDNIRTIREARELRVAHGAVAEDMPRRLVAGMGLADFRAALVPAMVEGNGLMIDAEAAKVLGLQLGAGALVSG